MNIEVDEDYLVSLEIEGVRLETLSQKQTVLLIAYRKAAEKFVDKVESGRARSKVTYDELKDAIKLHDEL